GSGGSAGSVSGGLGYDYQAGPSATALARAAKDAANKTEWANNVTSAVRDNGDLVLAVGDRIRHDDFGEGRGPSVTANGAEGIAVGQFDAAGRKRLLVTTAPIEKLQLCPPCRLAAAR